MNNQFNLQDLEKSNNIKKIVEVYYLKFLHYIPILIEDIANKSGNFINKETTDIAKTKEIYNHWVNFNKLSNKNFIDSNKYFLDHYKFFLTNSKDYVNIYFLNIFGENNDDLIITSLLAIGSYIQLFPKKIWLKLDKIIIVLNNNERIFKGKFNFDYSGHNNIDNKKITILCSKKEEIIKLIFHELCHFTKLDVLVPRNFTNGECLWNISPKQKVNLKINEAFAETYSILLNSSFSFAMINLFSYNENELTLEKIICAEIQYSLLLSIFILELIYNDPDIDPDVDIDITREIEQIEQIEQKDKFNENNRFDKDNRFNETRQINENNRFNKDNRFDETRQINKDNRFNKTREIEQKDKFNKTRQINENNRFNENNNDNKKIILNILDLFFDKENNLHQDKFISNIYIWEYVFMRTSLLLTDLTDCYYNYSNKCQFKSSGEFEKNKIIKFIIFDVNWRKLLVNILNTVKNLDSKNSI